MSKKKTEKSEVNENIEVLQEESKEKSEGVKFTKQELELNEVTYSEEEIKAFQEECGKKPSFTIADFEVVIKKDAKDITYKDVRILFSKIGWLDDQERTRFKNILVKENMTEEEIIRYTRIYPTINVFEKYFPSKEDVEELFNNHFKSEK